MELTNEEKLVIRVLLEKELGEVKDGKNILGANSPFFGKGVKGKNELPFLKSELKYEEFLQKLLKKWH